MTKYNEYYRRGYDDYWDGSVGGCPYEPGTSAYADWHAGWGDAADEDTKDMEADRVP